jgi:hypothetical protein
VTTQGTQYSNGTGLGSIEIPIPRPHEQILPFGKPEPDYLEPSPPFVSYESFHDRCVKTPNNIDSRPRNI